MNAVDSCGWIEHFSDGPLMPRYRPLLLDTATLVVPVICIYEVFKWLRRQRGDDVAIIYAATMLEGRLIKLDEELAMNAAQASEQHKLATADAIIYASARAHDAMLWTHDEHLRGLPGVEWVGD